MDDASDKPRFQKGGRPGPGRKRLALLAPRHKLTFAQAMDEAAAGMGSQLLALNRAAEERGLDADEREWYKAIVDRLALIEGQRVRLALAALVSEHLTPQQRDAVIAAVTGRAAPPVLEEVKP